MTTFYVDYENGNDASGGTTYEGRWKTIELGATAARIAPGDEIRVMASRDPFLLASGTWNQCGAQSGAVAITRVYNKTPITIGTNTVQHGYQTGDLVYIYSNVHPGHINGVWPIQNITPTGFDLTNSFAIPGGLPTGIAGGGSMIAYKNRCLQVSGAEQWNMLYTGSPAMTGIPGGTVVSTLSSLTNKIGNSTTLLTMGAAFAGGKIAHVTLTPSGRDLSSYNALSLWYRQTTNALSSGIMVLDLCSDKDGDNIVNTFVFPALTGVALNHCFTLPYSGGNNFLGTSISSLTFRTTADIAATVIEINNITACRWPSGITLNSLIGQTSSGLAYPIRSLEPNNIIVFENGNCASFNSINNILPVGVYLENPSNKEIWVTHPIRQIENSRFNDAGVSNSLISYLGGWDRTDMSTRVGRTWLDGINGGNGAFIVPEAANRSYILVDGFGLVRYTAGFQTNVSNNGTIAMIFNNFWACGCTNGVTATSSSQFGSSYFGTGICLYNNNTNGVTFGLSTATNCRNLYFEDLILHNNGMPLSTLVAGAGGGITLQMELSEINQVKAFNNCGVGVLFGCCSDIKINNLLAGFNFIGFGTNNLTAAQRVLIKRAISNNNLVASIANSIEFNVNTQPRDGGGIITVLDLFSSGNPVTYGCYGTPDLKINRLTSFDTTDISTIRHSARAAMYVNEYNNQEIKVSAIKGTIRKQNTVVRTSNSYAWQFSPLTTSIAGLGGIYDPLKLNIARVAVNPGSLVTTSIWARRDASGLNLDFYTQGGWLSGVPSDITVKATGEINNWEQLSMSFTPTDSGVVSFEVHAYSGSTFNGYIDDFFISQV